MWLWCFSFFPFLGSFFWSGSKEDDHINFFFFFLLERWYLIKEVPHPLPHLVSFFFMETPVRYMVIGGVDVSETVDVSVGNYLD